MSERHTYTPRQGKDAVDLIAAIIESAPNLAGYACKDKHDLFDSDDPDDMAGALYICSGCPVRRDCIRWIESTSVDIAGTLPAIQRKKVSA